MFCKKAFLQKVGIVFALKRSTFSTVFLSDINCARVKAIKVKSLDFVRLEEIHLKLDLFQWKINDELQLQLRLGI